MGKLVLMGSGGYTLHKQSEELDQFFLATTERKTPRICLLPTACGDREETIDRFYLQFTEYGASPTHLSLFMPHVDDIESFLLSVDGIYITGGNTKSMLALWREWEVDRALLKAYAAGIPIAGISAGALCFFEEGLTDSLTSSYTSLKGLGILNGSFCPHYSDPERASTYQAEIRTGRMKPGIGIGDGAALYYRNGILKRVLRPSDEILCEYVSLSEMTKL